MAIREDAEQNEAPDTSLTRSQAESAFLEKWQEDADEQPSKPSRGAKDKDEKLETSSESDDVEELIEDDDAESDEDQDDDANEAETIAGDNAKVKLTIDGKEVTASVKDLKRLYGQEQALTRKSQEVAEHRKAAEAQHATTSAAFKTLLERAEKAYEPYAGIDFLLASRQLEPEEFSALRTAALAAYENVKYLKTEVAGAAKAQEDQASKDYLLRAQECVKQLSDPEKGIKGWNQDLYQSISKFAVSQGLNEALFNSITDPTLMKLIHSAMRYDAAKKVTLKKKAETTKVIKGKKPSDGPSKFTRGGADAALKKLQQSGTRQDAADAFFARWQDKSDD